MDEYIDKLHIGGNDYDIYAVSATSALSASNAEKLQGLPASTFASATEFNALSETVAENTENISTLHSYFSGTSAKNAINATSASIAAAATSAAEADALKTPFGLTATNDYGSVSFAGIDGSADKTGTFTLDVATTIAPIESSTATGLAPASAVESALFEVEQKIGEITSFEVVTDHTQVTDPKTNIIYLEGPKGSDPEKDQYEEWIYTKPEGSAGTWTKIGETSIDLSNYYTKDETDDAISAAVADEETRAKAAEDVLSEQLTAEISRADAAEKANAAAITAEETRAKGVEEALDAEIDSTNASLNTHIATTAVHIQTGERDLWNTVSAMATSAEFTALEGRVTTAEGEIDTLQEEMEQAQEDITSVSSTVSGMKYYGRIKIGDKITSASAFADIFEVSGTDGILVSPGNGDGHPTIIISNTAVAPTFTGENGISVTSADNEWTISGKVATSADDGYGVTRASYVSGSTAYIF